ncbi:hypothetical protein C8R44DRAFT_807236 [Mycena epipterygia]|nr:hypothetical protein C8R44DRAFT_807236 [Mycena epipterygia]
MPLFDVFKSRSVAPEPDQASFTQPTNTSGLVVASELEKALDECKATVSRISKQCRANNEKFRDIEFDLENDKEACLNILFSTTDPWNPDNDQGSPGAPSDVRRVTQIFKDPKFFVDGATSNDIVQGFLGDCWFLSAVATASTVKGLLEKFCPAAARDEEVGVYGFVFYKDDHWVPVIIDDLLYTIIPKFEQLKPAEKTLYHNDKDHYNKWARQGSQTLYFAKSGTDGETWVPLIEKAYAKLHGDYGSLENGFACEAVEDLTGGVSRYIRTKDILNRDKFWTDELMNANKDRLFGCSFQKLDNARNGERDTRILGLIGSHAYSVLRAVEVKENRFVVIRNPWGQCEWTGRWSDGSKEWNADTRQEILPQLEHEFGDDGEFVMEYSDFLDCWDQLDRTRLLHFDSNWITSSHWLRVTANPLPSAWSFGDVCFTITIPKRSFTIIVLSQLDSRYFRPIAGPWSWSFDFFLFKTGETEPLATSSQSQFYLRSVNMELELDAGDYVVHVRLDRNVRPPETYYGNNTRKLSRLLASKAQSQLIASNFKAESQAQNLAVPVEAVAGLNFTEMKKKATEKLDAQKKKEDKGALPASSTPAELTTTTTTTKAGTVDDLISENAAEKTTLVVRASDKKMDDPAASADPPLSPIDAIKPNGIKLVAHINPPSETEWQPDVSGDDLDTVFLGLRVYTDKAGGPVTIGGELRHEMEAAFAKLRL